MRALLALAAALALAGCQVDLEGAACAAPGSSEQCPSGQRCGNDLRCSARAASCAATRCTPGERRCVDGDVRSCQGSDPVCGAWQVDAACAAGLECRGVGPEAACFCPANVTAEVVVDAGAGEPAGAPAPTGVRSPAACRFATLEAGLAAARDGVAPVVVAAGAPATYRVTASLAIPPGVTLRGDEQPPVPADRVLSLEGGLAVGVSLGDGATLSGFTVRNVSAAASAVGVDIACAGTALTRLSDVIVEEAASASSSLANGVRAGGACPVELERVTVRGVSAAGLLVARDAAASTLVATDAVLDGNGEGVHITRGDVTLERPVVTANAGAGVNASFLGTDVLLTIDHGRIRGNGDTGVVVEGSQAGRIRLAATRICSNQAATPRGGIYVQRKVGGLYLLGNPPPELALEGNALFGNGGDQLLVAGVDRWTLDGAADLTTCAARANFFAGYAPQDGSTIYVGLFVANATVAARWNAWLNSAPPLAGRDYATAMGGSVTGIDQYCPAPVPAPACD